MRSVCIAGGMLSDELMNLYLASVPKISGRNMSLENLVSGHLFLLQFLHLRNYLPNTSHGVTSKSALETQLPKKKQLDSYTVFSATRQLPHKPVLLVNRFTGQHNRRLQDEVSIVYYLLSSCRLIINLIPSHRKVCGASV